eukprot:scaffold114885_cov63-Phaeocystis_antarctica.AAC.5
MAWSALGAVRRTGAASVTLSCGHKNRSSQPRVSQPRSLSWGSAFLFLRAGLISSGRRARPEEWKARVPRLNVPFDDNVCRSL